MWNIGDTIHVKSNCNIHVATITAIDETGITAKSHYAEGELNGIDAEFEFTWHFGQDGIEDFVMTDEDWDEYYDGGEGERDEGVLFRAYIMA